jgi:hypothetical protein
MTVKIQVVNGQTGVPAPYIPIKISKWNEEREVFNQISSSNKHGTAHFNIPYNGNYQITIFDYNASAILFRTVDFLTYNSIIPISVNFSEQLKIKKEFLDKHTDILFLAPLVDVPTISSNYAVLKLLNYSYDIPNIDVDLLWGLGANRALFNKRFELEKYNAIFYWGHGKEDKLYGTHIISSVINDNNIPMLRGKVIDTMACFSAKKLGKFAIKNGVKSYIGTEEAYYLGFWCPEHNFLTDWIDYTSIRHKLMMSGYTIGEAYNEFIKKATKYASLYAKYPNNANFKWHYDTITHNIKNTILLGDKNATIF